MNKKKNIEVKTYASELIQVVLNMLNNAIDAHLESLRDDAFVGIDISSEESEVFIKIEDNAGGIDEKNLQHLLSLILAQRVKTERDSGFT